jgi:hypothetical protein
LLAVNILFTIGLGIEVAGAALLAWEAMTTVSSTLPSAATAEEQRSRSRALTGFGLLGLGVAVQVVGYAVGELWLLGLAAGVIAFDRFRLRFSCSTDFSACGRAVRRAYRPAGRPRRQSDRARARPSEHRQT